MILESNIEKKFSIPQEERPNGRRTQWSTSRRKIQFDEIMGGIRKLNKERKEQSMDRSSYSPAKEIKLIDRYRESAKKAPQEARKLIEKYSPKKSTIVNKSYLHEPSQNKSSLSSGSFKTEIRPKRTSSNKFRIEKEENSDDESDNLSPLKNRLTDFSMKR